jgi:hypothetical protein
MMIHSPRAGSNNKTVLGRVDCVVVLWVVGGGAIMTGVSAVTSAPAWLRAMVAIG